MERVALDVESRDETGKSVARKMRRDGFLPGVIYREGKSQPISLNRRAVVNFINASAGEQGIVDLKFSDGKTKIAIVKEYQSDPIRGELLHMDFFEVSLQEAITVTVPVTTVGEAVGVKRDGGILQHLLREIEIECLPDKIPGHVDVEISDVEIGQARHVSDIVVPEGVKVFNDPQEVVLTVAEPAKEVEEVPAEEEAEEPEVEQKGKKEEAPAEEAAEEKPKEE